ncbi:hypothetical protein P3T76_002480 [Phytophthora citrophthora]|uniref:Uncharacterized protein n=1 Tax=Phytophthora citrophthora TaxID=4793 RepID=A0AAD9GVM0_9STRA|nr:hypothetical protein P3T76_002480 [Phytophthora citrophthora]
MDNSPDNNPAIQLDLDERRWLHRHIALMHPRAPLNGQHSELNRSNVLYLLRVAPLTRMNNGAMELTPTGTHFNVKQRQLPRYAFFVVI